MMKYLLVLVFLVLSVSSAKAMVNLIGVQKTDGFRKAYVDKMKTFLGVPYGTGYGQLDCSALVQKVYQHFGISIPRRVTEQAETADISINVEGHDLEHLISKLKYGYQIGTGRTNDGRYEHAGTYVGKIDGKHRVLHASSSRKETVITELNDWWGKEARAVYFFNKG